MRAASVELSAPQEISPRLRDLLQNYSDVPPSLRNIRTSSEYLSGGPFGELLPDQVHRLSMAFCTLVVSRSSPGSGFGARLHGHGHKRAHEDSREQLADHGLGNGKRTRDRRHRSNLAADGGQDAKAEIGKLGDS